MMFCQCPLPLEVVSVAARVSGTANSGRSSIKVFWRCGRFAFGFFNASDDAGAAMDGGKASGSCATAP